MPSRLAVRAMRQAISPRLAMSTDENMSSATSWPLHYGRGALPAPGVGGAICTGAFGLDCAGRAGRGGGGRRGGVGGAAVASLAAAPLFDAAAAGGSGIMMLTGGMAAADGTLKP